MEWKETRKWWPMHLNAVKGIGSSKESSFAIDCEWGKNYLVDNHAPLLNTWAIRHEYFLRGLPKYLPQVLQLLVRRPGISLVILGRSRDEPRRSRPIGVSHLPHVLQQLVALQQFVSGPGISFLGFARRCCSLLLLLTTCRRWCTLFPIGVSYLPQVLQQLVALKQLVSGPGISSLGSTRRCCSLLLFHVALTFFPFTF